MKLSILPSANTFVKGSGDGDDNAGTIASSVIKLPLLSPP